MLLHMLHISDESISNVKIKKLKMKSTKSELLHNEDSTKKMLENEHLQNGKERGDTLYFKCQHSIPFGFSTDVEHDEVA